MTREELKQVIKILMASYVDKFKMEQSIFDIWCDCMGDLRFDVARKAAKEYIRKSQYPPTVADIRNEYNALWEEYMAMVRRINESFDSAVGYFPNVTEEQRMNGRKIFMELVSSVERDKREKTARDLSRMVIEYVKEREAGTEDCIVAFDTYMEKLANEFRSGKERNRVSAD